MDNIIKIVPNTKISWQHIKHAKIDEIFIEINRLSDAAAELECALVIACGMPSIMTDIIYSIQNTNGGVMNIQCKGNSIYIGNGIRITE